MDIYLGISILALLLVVVGLFIAYKIKNPKRGRPIYVIGQAIAIVNIILMLLFRD